MSDFEEFVSVIKLENLEKVKQLYKKEFLHERIGGWTPLHLASVYDNTGTIVKYLLSEGFKIEDETLYGEKCIHVAAERGMSEVVKTLIKEGCEVNSRTKEGQTPLEVALWWKQSKCVDILNKVKDNILLKDNKIVNDDKSINDHLELLQNNSLSKIMDPKTKKTLLDKLLCNKDPRIFEAIKSKTVTDEEIDEWKHIDLETIDPQSYKLLHECLLARCLDQGYSDGIYVLYNPELVNKHSLFMGPTALEMSLDCDIGIVREIIWKLVKEDENWAKVEELAKRKNKHKVLKLIDERRKKLIKKEELGFSRLHVAVLEEDLEMIEYLVRFNLVDVDEGYRKGGTALTLAKYIGLDECAETLENVVKSLNKTEHVKSLKK